MLINFNSFKKGYKQGVYFKLYTEFVTKILFMNPLNNGRIDCLNWKHVGTMYTLCTFKPVF